MPSQVRLRTEDDSNYAWHVKGPQIKKLFDKQLSGHSVGAYISLIEEVGRSFWAVHPQMAKKVWILQWNEPLGFTFTLDC